MRIRIVNEGGCEFCRIIRQEGKLNISTTSNEGKERSANTALWIVGTALFAAVEGVIRLCGLKAATMTIVVEEVDTK